MAEGFSFFFFYMALNKCTVQMAVVCCCASIASFLTEGPACEIMRCLLHTFNEQKDNMPSIVIFKV